MSFDIQNITIKKTDQSNGTASVKLVSKDDERETMFLNGFVINLNDGSSPVSVLRAFGSAVYNGTIIDKIIDDLLSAFSEDLLGSDPGIYIITSHGIDKIK